MRRVLPILGSAIFLVIAPGVVAGYVPWRISRWNINPPILGISAFRVIGACLIAAGIPVLLDSFARFALQGLGTPAPIYPTEHLVVSGWFRYVRNPMYVAVTATILGQGLLFGNRDTLEYGLMAWVVACVFVLLYEEPVLRKSFGAEYEEYCANVPRWIPRLHAWHREQIGRGESGNLALAAENARQPRHWTASDGVFADIRYALRTLRREPGFLAVAVVSLGLGIGANTAIFSFADAILFRPLPLVRPAEVLTLITSTPDESFGGLSYPNYRDLREKSRSFAGLVCYRLTTLGAASGPEPPEMRLTVLASDNFFEALSIAPALGVFHSGAERVAVLDHGFWESQYGGDPSIIGRPLRLNGILFTIVGVAPDSFPGLDRFVRPSIFAPLSAWRVLKGEATDPLEDRGRHELTVKGRLKAGVSLDSARAEVAALGLNLESAFPDTNRNRSTAVLTEIEARLRQEPELLAVVTILMSVVGLVLIIACSNIANLLLARAHGRRREVAIRLAIGAGRPRLVRQLMTESWVVTLLAGLAGLAVARAGIALLGNISLPSDVPLVLGFRLDFRVMLFSLVAALASCLFFGLAPALAATRTDLLPALKSAGALTSRRQRMMGRQTLVVGQIALAMVLLIAIGMFASGIQKMLRPSLGSRIDRMISVDLNPSIFRYTSGQTHDFYRKLVDRARALPGVSSVTLAESLPLAVDQSSLAVVPEGFQLLRGRERVIVLGGCVDDHYFSTMKVVILRGRAFRADDNNESRRVAIVNEQFAKTYWPNQAAVGKVVHLDSATGPVAEVVGVAATGRYESPTEAPRPYIYLPYEQNWRSRMTLAVESYGDPAAMAAPLRELIRSMDPNEPVMNLRTLQSAYHARVVSAWVLLDIMASMGLLGFTLAVIGLYGVISYSFSRRTAEIGIRMALGATRSDVLNLVLRQGAVLAVAGIALGGGLGVLLAPALTAGVFGLMTPNAATYVSVPISLLVVSVAACYLPAKRAAALDPMRTMRNE